MKRWQKYSVAALALWVCAEAFLYLAFGLGAPALSITDPQIEYLFKPNQHLRRFGNRIDINSVSMRSEELGPKQAGELRVLVWGDSVVNGGALTDQSQLASEILKRDLAKTHQGPVTVGNISAGSWGPANMLAYAHRYGFFDADVNIVVMSSHDAFDVPTFAPLNPLTHPTQNPLTPSADLLFRYLLPRLLKKDVEGLPDPSSRQNTVAEIQAFFALAKKSAPRLGVIAHRTRGETLSGKGLSGGWAILQICAAAGGVCVESMPAYQAYEGKQGEMYRDDIHPNENGQKLLAGMMLKLVNP